MSTKCLKLSTSVYDVFTSVYNMFGAVYNSLFDIRYVHKCTRIRRFAKKKNLEGKFVITSRVFGVRCSYLVCIELIRDVLRKNKIFDEKLFFSTKKYQDLRFFIGKNIFSSKFLVFLKTSLITSMHTKYEHLTPKTREVMTI